MSNPKQEVGEHKSYKILCLIDTDAQTNSISLPSKTSNNLLQIKRWNENDRTHDVDILQIDSTAYAPTEIEEILEPTLFYSTIEKCIDMYGSEIEKEAFYAFELDASVKTSRIRGDYSMLNHLGNGRNMRADKEIVLTFIEHRKHCIAKEYTKNHRTHVQPSWVNMIWEILNY